MQRILLPLLLTAAAVTAQPIRLHPENPHYFLFAGRPTVLVTSGEHYGAVLNAAFNYELYLDTLHKDHLNLTRVFSGSYREVPGNFAIADNTLAPAPGKFLAPWLQRDGKFDLTKWDDAYFARLKSFVAYAARRGVVVELVLFCPLYQDSMWSVSPMNIRNNVNAIGDVARTDVLALKDPRLTEVQDTMVRKIVSELRDFDNLYYEICNEPYVHGVTLPWQEHIAGVKDGKPRYQVDSAPASRQIKMQLPAGNYTASWRDTRTGLNVKTEKVKATNDETVLTSPVYSEDIALLLRR